MRKYRGIEFCSQCTHYSYITGYCNLINVRVPVNGDITEKCPLPVCVPISEVENTPEKFIRIIAVDFDGCLCAGKWPEVYPIRMDLVEKLLQEQKNGSKIILWSCRYGEELDRAVKACNEWGLHFDAVNDNIPEIIEAFGTNPRKITATEYWDDRAVRIGNEG